MSQSPTPLPYVLSAPPTPPPVPLAQPLAQAAQVSNVSSASSSPPLYESPYGKLPFKYDEQKGMKIGRADRQSVSSDDYAAAITEKLFELIRGVLRQHVIDEQAWLNTILAYLIENGTSPYTRYEGIVEVDDQYVDATLIGDVLGENPRRWARKYANYARQIMRDNHGLREEQAEIWGWKTAKEYCFDFADYCTGVDTSIKQRIQDRKRVRIGRARPAETVIMANDSVSNFRM